MILHCTLVPAPGSALTSGPVELTVDIAVGCSGEELQAAVSRRFGTGGLTIDRVAVAGLLVGERPLVNGAVLVDGVVPRGGGAQSSTADAAALVLAVHSGPGTGLIFPLRRGRFRLGRSGTEIVIPDAELSREHAQLDVTESAVTLGDLGSANGVRVDGRKVGAAAISTTSIIRCGGSSMSLVFGGFPDAGILAGAGSDVSEPLVVTNAVLHINRTALLVGAVLPLAIGVGMAALTGMWIFLAFTAVSGVSALVPVISGRRQRRDVRAAVARAAGEDEQRRRRAAPSAGELTLHGRSAGFGSPKVPAIATAPVWLRLGLAEQDANVRLEPPGPGFRPPPLGLLPVTLDPATPVTTLRGPESAVAGLARSFVVQLASYPAARRTRILIHGPTRPLLAARFLPGAVLSGQESSTLETLAAGPGTGYDRGVLIIAAAAAGVCAAAVSRGWQVLDCSVDPAAGPMAGTTVMLNGRTARISSTRSPALDFTPDLVPSRVFDDHCRRLAARGAAGAPVAGLPASRARDGLPPLSAADISARWAASAAGHGLPVVIGAGRSGPLRLDLQADGPHFLVAGTTGSGKSELLRTLAAGLAASHPPDRVNLLFVDFKGGSGLRPLAGLVHCVGLLTDLALDEVARALVSLRAEVHRREEFLLSHQAADLPAYEALEPAGPSLPHLVIIIDEFRMLVDEAPQALAELMRIAAIGRSLGIHLVMATQRPQGAVSADIRANVTSCIALRVQSELESIDVINSPLAAAIPITAPGRAFLVRGSEAPEEFQTATLTVPLPGGEPTITVLEAMEFLVSPSASMAPGAPGDAVALQPRAVRQLTDTVGALWQATGKAKPRRPVAGPLPRNLPFPADGGHSRVRLGLLDLPGEQRITEFGWHPGTHGHLALISGHPGCADAALKLTLDQLLTCDDEVHVYLLDAGGTLHAALSSPRTGAVVGLHELRRAVRVLERVSEEMAGRLGLTGASEPTPLVLALNGWGSWVSAFRSGPLAWAEDLFHDIVRDGPRAGIVVLVAGERELVTSRFFAGLPNRIYLPAGSTEEGRLAWPRLPAGGTLPGRAVVCGPMSVTPSAAGNVGQLFGPVPPVVRAGPAPTRVRPFRIEPLPGHVTAAEIRLRAVCGIAGTVVAPPGESSLPRARGPAASKPASRAGQLWLGVAGDEPSPAGVHFPHGAVLAVLGGRASGKSSLLSALPGLNPDTGFILAPAATDPERFWAKAHDAARAGALDPETVFLVDDLDRQSPEINSHLLLLNNLGWRVVLTAGFNPAIRQRVALIQNAVGQERGILIGPRTLMDGDVFGVRFDLEQSPPPGRAVLISEGRACAVQLAFDPAAEARSGP